MTAVVNVDGQALSGFVAGCCAAAEPAWSAYASHAWLEALFNDTLLVDQFLYFHRYGVVYSADMHRALALGVAKAPAGSDWAKAAIRILHETFIANKRDSKVNMLRSLGLKDTVTLDREDSIPSRDAYGAHLLRIAWERDLPEVAAALLPCAMFTSLIGERFANRTVVNRVYDEWIHHYVNDRDMEMTRQHIAVMEAAAADGAEETRKRMKAVFRRSVEYQVRVFDAAWLCSDEWIRLRDR